MKYSERIMKMKKIKSSKKYYIAKIIFLLILWSFCSSFMETCVNSFVYNPDIPRFVSSLPLIYASYKCIIEIVKNAFIIKVFEFAEKENDWKSE